MNQTEKPNLELPQVFSGTVVHGKGRGHKELGFPTANLSSESWTVKLTKNDFGVYAGIVNVLDEKPRIGIISIGENPTFNDMTHPTFEVHILDFDADIYGEIMKVTITNYLRPMISFKSLQDLINAITNDGLQARQLLSNQI